MSYEALDIDAYRRQRLAPAFVRAAQAISA